MKPSNVKVYAREATGLVKSLSAFDLFNVAFGQIMPAAAIVYGPPFAAYAFPQSNMFYAYLLGIPLVGGIALVYAFLASAMPRSGGDYIFNSRILHPAIGFMSSFVFTLILVFAIAIGSSVWSSAYAAGFLAAVGQILGSSELVTASSWFATQTGVAIVGTIAVLATGLLVLYGRASWTFMKVMAVLVLAFCIINILFLAATPQSVFAEAFNQQYPGQYEGIISQAESQGWVPGYTLSATYIALIFAMGSYLGFNFCTYSAGEAKYAAKSMPIGVMGSFIVGGLMFSAWMGAIYHAFGYDFYSAAGYLFTSGQPVPIPPMVNYLFTVIPQSPVLKMIGALAFILGFTWLLPTSMLPASRNIFAWSFDRMIPEKLSYVSDTTHTPIYATALLVALGEVALLGTVFAGVGVVMAGQMILAALLFLITSISAILFPFRTKRIFEQAPGFVKQKLVGIPIITIIGIYATSVSIWLLYGGIINPMIGGGPTGYPFTVGIIVAGLAFYYIVKWARRRQGIDVSLAFTDLPPE